ncbi:IS3 family transposase [Parafrankia sp. EUN1f]|uniref:IS3 family transposase n=1 Tax=Parafrankia sp. EUN1f TaxID=102897 RepID=UPI0001C46FC5|nr:IS3 family transposase [Parafrankia sp. EUN1f]EFC86760.1 conserved hypothetical protein [Parafrankia sp. EUN1f]
MLDYIDERKERFGVESICAVLKDAGVQTAPSTYNASKRPPLRRAVNDAETLKEIERVHDENHGVYGVRKAYAQLGREGGVGG